MSPDTPRYPLGVTGTPHREQVLRCTGGLVRPLSSMALYQRLSVAPLVWSQDMGLPHPILLPLASSVTMGLWSLIFLSSEMRLIRCVTQGQPDSSSAGSCPKALQSLYEAKPATTSLDLTSWPSCCPLSFPLTWSWAGYLVPSSNPRNASVPVHSEGPLSLFTTQTPTLGDVGVSYLPNPTGKPIHFTS